MTTLSLPLHHRTRRTLTAFNPALPVDGSLVVAGELRDQFNGLKSLIDAIQTLTSAVVDGTDTLPAGSPASVAVSVSSGVLHFTFEIPQGNEGPQGATGSSGSQGEPGPQGPPFTNFVVDNVNQLPPGSWPVVQANFDGAAVRFNFGIPQGLEGPQGVQGVQGPPFANAVVDGVTTLNPNEPASVSVSFDGTNVHFAFGIPRGQDGSTGSQGEPGPQGIQGPPGEVSLAQLEAAIAGTSANSNAVAPLTFGADPSYNAAQMQDVIAKVNELISALRR